MRILKIFDGAYPWDVRVEKVTEALLAAGHEVALLCRNRNHLPRRERLSNGLQIFRTPDVRPPLDFPAFVNPLWISSAVAAAREIRPQLLLARDLPLTPLALAISRWLRVPVVADLAEPYPDSLRAHFTYQHPSLLDWIVRNPRIADWVERLVLARVEHAIVVCPEAGFRLVRNGLPPDRWTEVRNTVDSHRFRERGRVVEALAGLDGRFLILFSGLLSGDRGVEVALEAVAELCRRHPSRFAFIVTGEGPVRSSLERRAAQLGIASHVRFTGWMEYDQLPDLIAGCDVGILPFHRCPHIEASLANKLFEYMTLGLPVVVTDVLPMRRIVEDAGCGRIVSSGDSHALASAIEQLADAPEERAKLSEAGTLAARAVYRWDLDAERLCSVIEYAAARGATARKPRATLGPAPLLGGALPHEVKGVCR